MTKDNNSDDNSPRKLSPEEEKERDEYQLEVIENQRAENEFMREHVPVHYFSCSSSPPSESLFQSSSISSCVSQFTKNDMAGENLKTATTYIQNFMGMQQTIE